MARDRQKLLFCPDYSATMFNINDVPIPESASFLKWSKRQRSVRACKAFFAARRRHEQPKNHQLSYSIPGIPAAVKMELKRTVERLAGNLGGGGESGPWKKKGVSEVVTSIHGNNKSSEKRAQTIGRWSWLPRSADRSTIQDRSVSGPWSKISVISFVFFRPFDDVFAQRSRGPAGHGSPAPPDVTGSPGPARVLFTP